MNRNCDGCSKEISASPYKVKTQKYIFCSNECYKANIGKYFAGELNPNFNSLECTCESCGKTFLRKPSQIGKHTFCNNECYGNWVRPKTEPKGKRDYSCDYCGGTFKRYPSQVKDKKWKYCSVGCKNSHNSVIHSGENHPNWNPELTDEDRINARKYPEYFAWRANVFLRDSFTCRCCGDSKGGNLIAHHIYNFAEHTDLRTEMYNGVTVCDECHKEFHDSFGYTQNDLTQLIEYFKLKGRVDSALFALDGMLIPSEAC